MRPIGWTILAVFVVAITILHTKERVHRAVECGQQYERSTRGAGLCESTTCVVDWCSTVEQYETWPSEEGGR